MVASLVRGAVATLILSAAILTWLAQFAEADPVVPGEEHCVVNVRSDDVLNMREHPNARAPVVARKRYGECGLLVTGECRGNWCPVENPGERLARLGEPQVSQRAVKAPKRAELVRGGAGHRGSADRCFSYGHPPYLI